MVECAKVEPKAAPADRLDKVPKLKEGLRKVNGRFYPADACKADPCREHKELCTLYFRMQGSAGHWFPHCACVERKAQKPEEWRALLPKTQKVVIGNGELSEQGDGCKVQIQVVVVGEGKDIEYRVYCWCDEGKEKCPRNQQCGVCSWETKEETKDGGITTLHLVCACGPESVG